MPRIAIIGTGLIGASIGLGLKASGEIEGLEVAGYDRSSDNLKQAKRMGALDFSARDAQEAVRGAAIVVLATPLLAMRRIMHEIAPALEQGAVVTDTGSTKAEVMEWAAGELPQPVAFVGGHPMAGKTDAGPDSAEAGLFRNARWVIVPATRSAATAVDAVRGMIETLGAKVTFMDAEEHDAYVAAISHLPLMAATALFTLAHGSDAWPELSQLAASGFKDTTRLAGTEPNMAFRHRRHQSHTDHPLDRALRGGAARPPGPHRRRGAARRSCSASSPRPAGTTPASSMARSAAARWTKAPRSRRSTSPR